jgi:hypothetical protein
MNQLGKVLKVDSSLLFLISLTLDMMDDIYLILARWYYARIAILSIMPRLVDCIYNLNYTKFLVRIVYENK